MLQMTAKSCRRLNQMRAVSPPTKDACCLKSGRPSANNQNQFIGPARSELLRVPAAAILFEGRRVLSANNLNAMFKARNALIAADAFGKVLNAALINLPGEQRIGNGGTGAANYVASA